MNRRWRAAGWVFLLVALPRLAYLLIARPAFSGIYWALSEGLLRDGSLAIDRRRTTDFEPLYPIFLAVSRTIVRHDAFLVQLLQVAVAAAGGICFYYLTARLTGRPRTALLAAALYAASPLLVRQAVVLSDSALVTTLLIAFAGAFAGATTVAGAALAGFWLGLAVLTRTVALPLVALGTVLLISDGRHRAALTLFVIAMALVLPLPIRNHLVNGSTWPTRSGLNLFAGNSTYTSTLLPDHTLDTLREQAASVVDARLPHSSTIAPESVEHVVDTLLTQEAIAYIAAHPIQTMRQKALNVLYFFSPRLVPYRIATPETRLVNGVDGKISVEHTEPRPLVEVIVYAASSSVVLVCAMAGIYFRRRCLSRDAVLWCIALTFVAVNVIYVPATRYRAPMEFVLLFYAAVGLEEFSGHSRDLFQRVRNWRLFFAASRATAAYRRTSTG